MNDMLLSGFPRMVPAWWEEVVEMLADAPIQAVIPASDLDRAKAFYRDTLGFSLVAEYADEAVEFTGGGCEFQVYRTPSGGQAAHTLASWKVADLDAEMKDLRARGIVFEEYDLPGGIKTLDGVAEMEGLRAAWFKDSEGNILCVAQPPR